jgi:hypothetical protein
MELGYLTNVVNGSPLQDIDQYESLPYPDGFMLLFLRDSKPNE